MPAQDIVMSVERPLKERLIGKKMKIVTAVSIVKSKATILSFFKACIGIEIFLMMKQNELNNS